ncbi:MAG: response regulator transcription factor [Spirochaetales bacterium]|nr:response regulator transcription factor [Spirochaetales bacterium]
MKKILIVDDHKIVLEGLEAKLSNRFRIYSTVNGKEARTIAMENTIDAAILDITIGTENGLDLAFDLRKAIPQILFFSMHKSPAIIEQVMHNGYAGFFLKDESIDKMIMALENPQITRFWMTDSVKALLKEHKFDGDDNYDRLTTREQQIFRMIAEGMKPRDIAGKINISTKTISVHRENLMRKMGVKNNSEIVRLAIKLEIIEL